MYTHEYDKETNGLILTKDVRRQYLKEPRPVYFNELITFGFDKYFKFDNQSMYPYMWYEKGDYVYEGNVIAHAEIEDFQSPQIVLNNDIDINYFKNNKLKHVDIDLMVRKNKNVLDAIEQTSKREIINIYNKVKDKIDAICVACSGGKDSSVVEHIVGQSIPNESYSILFNDTQMENVYTIENVKNVKLNCESNGRKFYESSPKFSLKDSWKLVGPPSSILRWCCVLQKSTPNLLQLEKITNTKNPTSLVFTGVRRQESPKRFKYEMEVFGKKVINQYSYHPIIDWSSAEVWLYIYYKKLDINNVYKLGYHRAGCVFCPLARWNQDYLNSFYNAEKNTTCAKILDESVDTHLAHRWKSRRTGNSLVDNDNKIFRINNDECIEYTIKNPTMSWREWFKILGEVFQNGINEYYLFFRGDKINFNVMEHEKEIKISIKKDQDCINNREFFRRLLSVIKKISSCIGCRTCEVECKYGNLKFFDNELSITNCVHCFKCCDNTRACLVYDSRKRTKNKYKKRLKR